MRVEFSINLCLLDSLGFTDLRKEGCPTTDRLASSGLKLSIPVTTISMHQLSPGSVNAVALTVALADYTLPLAQENLPNPARCLKPVT